jgi:peptidoglycan/LPS O-acetylase OafA/YrhL
MALTEVRDPTRSWTRLDGVDLLRGLAIFFVLMNHVNMRADEPRSPQTLGDGPAELGSVTSSIGTPKTRDNQA